MKGIIVILSVFISMSAIGQTCIGKWLTLDDNTHKEKSIVKLYRANGKMYGKIEKVYDPKGMEPDAKCDLCEDDRKDKPLIGLQIVRGMKWNGTEWEGGTIVDPENGKIYKVKMWLDSENSDMLVVRGYSGPFYRTQYWKRIE